MTIHRTHFEPYEDEVGEFRWRLVAGNGEIVCVSEGYTTVHDCLRSIAEMPTWVAAAFDAGVPFVAS